MDTKLLIELFGYLGSALVVVSMLMSSVVRLRVINTIGSVIFAIYALIIHSYPTALMNFFLVGINIYQLIRLLNTGKHYDLFEETVRDGYLAYFLNYYRSDIVKFFPMFSPDKLSREGTRVFAVCCDREVAGLLAGVQEGDTLNVLLDYSTPVYRDCSVGAYLYGRLPEYGVKHLTYSENNKNHIGYLQKMGFEQGADQVYRKTLDAPAE